MHEQAIQHYFADKEPMLVEAVSRLVRIDSTLGPALPGKPFGEGPAAALEELLALWRGLDSVDVLALPSLDVICVEWAETHSIATESF